MSTRAVPAFFLYGETVRDAEPRFLHLESIAARSRPANWIIRAHAHRDLAHMLFVARGGGRMRVETEILPFRAPAVLISAAGSVHGFDFEPETDGHVLTLADTYVRELVVRMPECRRLFEASRAIALDRIDFHAHGFAQSLERLGQELVWAAPGRAIALEGHLLCVLVGVLRIAALPAASKAINPNAALFARFREVVEERFRTSAGISDYSDVLGVTPSRLRSACIGVAGSSPVAIVNDRIMVEAKRMLLYTSMTISEVAYEVGFQDPAYFSRFFAGREGRPPSMFRAAAHGDGVDPVP
jgi:AraC family transcriptional activator of pobA